MRKTKPMHGTAKALGCEHLSLGRFCRLFPDLTSWAKDCGVTSLCEAEHIAAVLGGANGLMHDVDSDPYVKSKAFDHLLADELVRLPIPVVGRNAPVNDQSLAFRNLLRGYVLGLPSGQKVREAVAALGYPIDPTELDLKLSELRGFDCLDKKLRDKLACHTPLFLYLMREAGLNGGKRLGPVGSAIVLQVFGAMLVYCKSFLHDKDWKVDPCVARCDGQGLTLADFVRYVEGSH
ncbi:MAG: hypothetical protein RL885_13185 [Planctomycetota bacterium]